jgi:ribosomal protein S18 acetylase RimI-like enzyme
MMKDFLNGESLRKYIMTRTAMLLMCNGEYIGFITYVIPIEQPYVIHISAFGIKSHERGKGYGRTGLFNFIVSCRIRMPTAKIIRLGVNVENTKARNLYKSLGFKVTRSGVDEKTAFEIMELAL